MRKAKTVRILISLPLPLKQYLDDLRRLEHVTISGYIQQQIRGERQARMESGWRPTIGWAYRDTPAWQKRELAWAEAWRKLEESKHTQKKPKKAKAGGHP